MRRYVDIGLRYVDIFGRYKAEIEITNVCTMNVQVLCHHAGRCAARAGPRAGAGSHRGILSTYLNISTISISRPASWRGGLTT